MNSDVFTEDTVIELVTQHTHQFMNDCSNGMLEKSFPHLNSKYSSIFKIIDEIIQVNIDNSNYLSLLGHILWSFAVIEMKLNSYELIFDMLQNEYIELLKRISIELREDIVSFSKNVNLFHRAIDKQMTLFEQLIIVDKNEVDIDTTIQLLTESSLSPQHDEEILAIQEDLFERGSVQKNPMSIQKRMQRYIYLVNKIRKMRYRTSFIHLNTIPFKKLLLEKKRIFISTKSYVVKGIYENEHIAVKFYFHHTDNQIVRDYNFVHYNIPHMTKIYGIVVNKQNEYGIVMQYYPSTLDKEVYHLDFLQKFSILRDVAVAVEYSHNLGFVQNGLSPSHVFLASDGSVALSRHRSSKETRSLRYYPLYFIERSRSSSLINLSSSNSTLSTCRSDLECISSSFSELNELEDSDLYLAGKYSPATDIWSFAILFVEIMSGVKPFDNFANNEIQEALLCGKKPYEESLMAEIPCGDIIYQCFAEKVYERPSFSEIIDYLDSYFAIYMVNQSIDLEYISPTNESLHSAILQNDLSLIYYLLNNTQVDVNKKDAYGKPAIFYAFEANSFVIAKYLMNFGAESNFIDPSTGWNFAHLCACYGYLKLLRAVCFEEFEVDFISIKDRKTPLHVACENRRLEIIQFLITFGADVNALDNNFESALHKVVLNNHIDAIQLLLAEGATIDIVDKEGRTPLRYAVDNQFVEVAYLLISNGANVNFLDVYGKSMIFRACEINSFELVNLLVNANADILLSFDDETPLSIAKKKGDSVIADYLTSYLNENSRAFSCCCVQ
eukprot:TRINITY_DN2937_c0_g1_i1.p1 TRINITY_DN2937_c0_g1~~TRINITY_DN2937_c0_g1_i1.p1  ORF type:complete len:782 (-),score=191.21 TRINITY_DN2937_c0_g1_i1:1317-3662(-)